MRPRNGLRPSAIVLALVASALASCATNPPRRDDTPEILEIREDYLRANPNGPFNGEIRRGEAALGMGYHDLLAAWGMPDSRVAERDRDEEWWTYVVYGDNGVDWIRYDFLFEKRIVVEWETSRAVASGFVPLRDDLRSGSLRVPSGVAPSLGEGARKGGSGAMIR